MEKQTLRFCDLHVVPLLKEIDKLMFYNDWYPHCFTYGTALHTSVKIPKGVVRTRRSKDRQYHVNIQLSFLFIYTISCKIL